MMTDKKIRVLVVDDSALMRKKISDIINSDEECEVVATARNGEEALKGVAMLRPDVITLDVELPRMDGITALKYIMSEWPTPTVMISGVSEYGGEEVIKCLEYGAVDIVAKPSGVISLDIERVKSDILTKVKAASRVNTRLLRPALIKDSVFRKDESRVSTTKLIVIASSTGGPKALAEVLPKLAPGIQAGIIVVQHLPEGFSRYMAERLNSESFIEIKEAEDGDLIRQGRALIAPGGMHLTVVKEPGKEERIRLHKGPREHGVCPAADVAMRSIAPLYGGNCLGVILTGMGSDGTEGARAIKQAGGHVIAQDEATSVIYGMPRVAYEAGAVDEQFPLPCIADEILRWSGRS